MSAANGNKLLLVFVPLISVVLAYFGMPYTKQLPPEIIEKLAYAPYLIFVGTTLLGGFFKRHRIALSALVLGLSYLVFHNVSAVANDGESNTLIFACVAFLLPFNLAMLAGLKEQQVMSLQSFAAATLILLQFILAYWLTQNYTNTLAPFLLYEMGALKNTVGITLSLPVVISFLLSLGVLGFFAYKSKGVFEIAFLGALISVFMFFNTGFSKPTDTIYISLAGLILLWGLMHNSYLIAYIDELTELPGRRAMNEELSRVRGLYTIAMMDIDFFKKFNDTYGHDVGDQVLRMVASKIKQIGGGGKPFRYGGEEFAIIFAGKDSKSAFPFLSNLRETIDDTRLILRSQDRPAQKPEKIPPRRVPWQEVHVTISIGVAHRADELQTTEQVMKAADEALYRSKEMGRNRISQHSTKDYAPELRDEDALE